MTRYNPAVIQKHADRLYSTAFSVVVLCTLVGLLIGVAFGAVVAPSMNIVASGPMIIGALIIGSIGCALGFEMSFAFHLRAQLALCQMSIEVNTRRAASASGQPQPTSPWPTE